MKLINTKVTAIAAAMSLAVTASVSMAMGKKGQEYEVWAADQSNSVSGVTEFGHEGSYIWVWKSKDVNKQLKDGTPADSVGCGLLDANIPGAGPCDINGTREASD